MNFFLMARILAVSVISDLASGLICYSCDHVRDANQCKPIDVTDRSMICYTEISIRDRDVFFTQGAMRKSECNKQARYQNDLWNGGVISSKGDKDCKMCCKEDECNKESCFEKGNTAQSTQIPKTELSHNRLSSNVLKINDNSHQRELMATVLTPEDPMVEPSNVAQVVTNVPAEPGATTPEQPLAVNSTYHDESTNEPSATDVSTQTVYSEIEFEATPVPGQQPSIPGAKSRKDLPSSVNTVPLISTRSSASVENTSPAVNPLSADHPEVPNGTPDNDLCIHLVEHIGCQSIWVALDCPQSCSPFKSMGL